MTLQDTNITSWSLTVLSAFILLSGGAAAAIVQERTSNVKRLLLLSGASKRSYWLSNFVWDWMMFLLIIIASTIVMAVAGRNVYDSEAIGAAVSTS